MGYRRTLLLVVAGIFSATVLIGCASKDPTVSQDEQETTREHHREYRDNADF